MRTNLLKKGGFDITPEAWKVLIVAILVLVVMLFVQSDINQGAQTNADNSACKTSVIQNAYSKIPNILGDKWASDINCPVQEITIDESDDKEIMEQTAEAMYTCWDNFGKGKLNIFPTKRGADDVFCVICSEITYAGAASGKEISEFTQYLIKNNPPGKQTTYYEEFMGELPTQAVIDDLQDPLFKDKILDTKGSPPQYAVVFTYIKNIGVYDRMIKGAAAGGIALVGAIGLVELVGGFFTFGATWAAIPVTFAVATAGGATIWGFVTGPNLNEEWRGSIELLPIENPESLAKLGCTKLGVNPVTEEQ
jgi:hypothetical protein